MLPKPQAKKLRKPLTSLQRKRKTMNSVKFTASKLTLPNFYPEQKRKYDLIHKAQVKSQYYKELNKNTNDDTPDYVKEIFGAERTIDKDGNVVELERDEQEEHLDPSSSEEECEDNNDNDDKSRREQKSAKSSKPNPFKVQLEERQRLRKESLNEKEERQKKYRQEKKARLSYYKGRSQERSKMLARTKKGQPKMASQMDVLLEKIQKTISE
ncbi:hypothetical protein [Parasitella parasitica]|uniref:rRNA-processing protein FYV7 n=1 Tax=Parasitella parasitica TaxID=35722 RepID=A0A0B7MZP0_9FUNG|nr:hypothetical protein [Parasitella parasitica]